MSPLPPRLLPLVTTALWLVAAPTWAQDDDWHVVAAPGAERVIATADYSSGVSLQIECTSNRLAVAITGLPRTREDSVVYRRTLPDGRTETSVWSVGDDDSTRVSPSPGRYARLLKRGGVFALTPVAVSEDSPGVRLDLPSQSTGIDRVLTACGADLVESGDDVQEVGELLHEYPNIEPPNSIFRDHPNFQIDLVCIVRDSRLSDCRSPKQAPPDERAGNLLARRANGTRLRLADPQAVEGREYQFVITGSVVSR